MSNSSSSSSGGVGFIGLLTIVFIVLKLCEVINWSWWWVVSPILISIVGCVVFVGFVLLWYILFGGYKH
ncbi:hypothetical protein LCGC14_2060960 [marine sediment metagenome]|uniref:Transmembrane Fragile-X-F protein n=1 Tax=marine sediment metagenome TaxID=412755 RepID=A0A0F9F8N0_9ZZZZ